MKTLFDVISDEAISDDFFCFISISG